MENKKLLILLMAGSLIGVICLFLYASTIKPVDVHIHEIGDDMVGKMITTSGMITYTRSLSDDSLSILLTDMSTDNSIRIYVRDLHDHVVQVREATDSYRDMLASMLDIYLSSISNSMNAVMKVLTIIGTIFIPLTFIVGVYGMNFRHMPELALRWAYPTVWGVMIVLAAVMLIYFRRKDWL